MTREEFQRRTGREPVNDDIERATCPLAGRIGHKHCGLCPHGLPRFEVCYGCHPEWHGK